MHIWMVIVHLSTCTVEDLDFQIPSHPPYIHCTMPLFRTGKKENSELNWLESYTKIGTCNDSNQAINISHALLGDGQISSLARALCACEPTKNANSSPRRLKLVQK